MKNIFLILLLFTTTALCSYGQIVQSANENIGEPMIGKRCPDFKFTKVDFYEKSQVSLNDFKGRWLVMDFWSRNCSACVESFPAISSEQKEFGDSIQFLMVAPDQDVSLYVKYHNRLHLRMPGAFDGADDAEDSWRGIFKAFNVGTLPHIVIIDPNGIVRAITVSAPSEKLHALLSGKGVQFARATYADRKERVEQYQYNYSRGPYLVNGNGGPDSVFLYRSLLSQWSPLNPIEYHDLNPPDARFNSENWYKAYHDKGRFDCIGVSLDMLYLNVFIGRCAIHDPYDTSFYGKFWPKPILEMRDTSLFKYDYVVGEHVYCYSLVVPPAKASIKYMMQIAQSDLNNYFGYQVVIETRKMPCWRLVATGETSQLITKGDGSETVSYGPRQGAKYRNTPMKILVKAILGSSGIYKTDLPLIDETGIKDNIDVDFDAVKNDPEATMKILHKYNLDLVKGEKEMKVLVIRDPN